MIAALVLVLALGGASERFEDLAFRLANVPVDPACATMQGWVDEHVGRDDAARGLIWIARRRLAAHDREAARTALSHARDARGRFGAEAVRLLAALDLEDNRLDDALDGAALLAASSEPRVNAEGQALIAEITARKLRNRERALAFLFLAVDVAVRIARTRKKLWPPPFEALALGPILAMLALVGVARGLPGIPALLALAVAGTALAWARGAHRRARPLALPWRIADAALALVEAGALGYAILDGTGVLDTLLLTFTAGPA
ncbi:MAG TPA: hypothetical protein VGO62_00965 [Myxococcota bacterium]